jgi:hypothetical protein
VIGIVALEVRIDHSRRPALSEVDGVPPEAVEELLAARSALEDRGLSSWFVPAPPGSRAPYVPN